MSKSILLNIETQTEEGHVISVCHINENTLALETSEIARRMFRLNRPLFDRLNASTKMLGGALYRQEVTKQKANINRLLVPIDDKFDVNEFEISQLFFENNILKKQQRGITKRGTKVDYDPALVKDSSENSFFDANNITKDDLNDMKMICSVEEIGIFQDQGVKSILITDNLEERKSLLKVSYRIELEVDTDFGDYVSLILERLENSSKFLIKYLNNIETGMFYDNESLMFKSEYSKSVLADLGINSENLSANLGSQRIKDSEFGKVALNYYNAMLLLTPNVSKLEYGKMLKSILPTALANPNTISKAIQNLSTLLFRIRQEYLSENKSARSDSYFSKIKTTSSKTNKLEALAIEGLELEKERLGYSVFSNNQKGLNKFTIGDYQGRYMAEQAKYYPTLAADDQTSFLTSRERGQFGSLANAPACLTPTGLIMGHDVVSTDRGMRNMPINKVREFRLAKSARAQQASSQKFPNGIERGRMSTNAMSDFNIQIGAPKPTLLSRATEQEIDPYVDAKDLLGSISDFSTNNPTELIRNFRRIMSREDKRILSIVSDIVPRRFLRKDKAIKSIKELKISNPKSNTRSLLLKKEISLEEIPPQIKFMMTEQFNPNPDSDPLKNAEAREIIEETQKNLFLVRALVGFEKDAEGFLDVYRPILEDLNEGVLSSGRPILAKAYDYEIPELGIVKDKFAATIYSNLIYIRG